MPGNVQLTDNQRRHYSVVFGRIEQSLSRLEDAASSAPPRDVLTFSTADLPPRFADDARPILDEARAIVADVAQTLALEPRGVSRRRTCRALITSELVQLEDCYAGRLRGYGAVDPSVSEHLDPLVAKLHASFEQLESLLKAKHGATGEA